MAAPKRVGFKDGQGVAAFALPAKPAVRTLAKNEAETAYLYVRDRVLNPALEKRLFRSDAELGGYFNLRSVQSVVIERLVAQGFAKRTNHGLELCRFDVSTLSHALSLRAQLDGFSFRLALPRLGENELARIDAAVLAFSAGPRLAEACHQILVIMSVLHETAGRPLLSAVTEDLHRRLVPYAHLDRDQNAYENLMSFFARLPRLLQAGRLEALCSELSSTYKQNAQIIAPALADFRRFHEALPAARVARAIPFQAAA
jgi:DNA-binding GntR family transcriptional regulator